MDSLTAIDRSESETNNLSAKTLASDDSGNCGNDVTYSFVAATGTLTISGFGEMSNYKLISNDSSSYTSAPWNSYKNSITSVIIENGVTSLGMCSFFGCTCLTSVSIPNSITLIGGRAFEKCSRLISIAIPDSVTEIGAYSFDGCSKLTFVNIPNSVTKIGFYTFWGCNLSSVNIPNSVTEIGNFAFSDCSNLTSVLYKGIYDPGASSTGVFENCNKLNEVKVPINYNSDTFCDKNASKCLVFGQCGPNADWLFDECDNSLTISGYSDMNGFSQDNLPWNSYKNPIASVKIEDGLTSICNSAFNGCCNLISVSISDSVTSIAYSAFANCENLNSVTIGNSATSIGESAFHNCHKLKQVNIPDSVFSIDKNTRKFDKK